MPHASSEHLSNTLANPILGLNNAGISATLKRLSSGFGGPKKSEPRTRSSNPETPSKPLWFTRLGRDEIEPLKWRVDPENKRERLYSQQKSNRKIWPYIAHSKSMLQRLCLQASSNFKIWKQKLWRKIRNSSSKIPQFNENLRHAKR